MTRRGNLLALRPEDDLQSSMKTLAAKLVAYAAVIGEGGQFAGLLYLSNIPRFLDMQPLLDPLDPNKGQSNLPPTPTFKGQDETPEDKVGGPPRPPKWIK